MRQLKGPRKGNRGPATRTDGPARGTEGPVAGTGPRFNCMKFFLIARVPVTALIVGVREDLYQRAIL